MRGEAVDAEIEYEPKGEKGRDLLTFGKLHKDVSSSKKGYKCMMPTEIALTFEGIGPIPPGQNMTHNPNWKKRSVKIQGDDKRHASVSLVFRILQLIRQET